MKELIFEIERIKLFHNSFYPEDGIEDYYSLKIPSSDKIIEIPSSWSGYDFIDKCKLGKFPNVHVFLEELTFSVQVHLNSLASKAKDTAENFQKMGLNLFKY